MVMPLTKSKKLDDSAARSAESAAQSEVGVAAMSTTLVADIGGSKSRFALSNSSGEIERVLVIDNDTVAGLDAAVAYYLEETGARPRAATLAVAGSVGGEEVVLTNRAGWRVLRAEVAEPVGARARSACGGAAFRAPAWTLCRRAGAHLQGAGRRLYHRRGRQPPRAAIGRAAVPCRVRGAPAIRNLTQDDPDSAHHLRAARADRLRGSADRACANCLGTGLPMSGAALTPIRAR